MSAPPFLLDCHVDTIQRVVDEGADLSAGVPAGQVDLPRLRRGGVGVVFFACWVSPDYLPDRCFERALALARAVHEQARRHPGELAIVRTMAEARRAVAGGRIAGVLGVEGGHAIEDDLGKLAALAELGVRYMTLTWNNHLPWAESCAGGEDAPRGLTRRGRAIVERMAELGVVADLSHASPRTFADVLALDVPPPICSHSAAASIHPHRRNLSDAQIERLAARGGAVGLTFVPAFLGDPETAGLDTALIHARRLLEIGGPELLGIGSDFDGIEHGPKGLEDCSKLGDFLAGLALPPEHEAAVAHANLMRVFEAWE